MPALSEKNRDGAWSMISTHKTTSLAFALFIVAAAPANHLKSVGKSIYQPDLMESYFGVFCCFDLFV